MNNEVPTLEEINAPIPPRTARDRWASRLRNAQYDVEKILGTMQPGAAMVAAPARSALRSMFGAIGGGGARAIPHPTPNPVLRGAYRVEPTPLTRREEMLVDAYAAMAPVMPIIGRIQANNIVNGRGGAGNN